MHWVQSSSRRALTHASRCIASRLQARGGARRAAPDGAGGEDGAGTVCATPSRGSPPMPPPLRGTRPQPPRSASLSSAPDCAGGCGAVSIADAAPQPAAAAAAPAAAADVAAAPAHRPMLQAATGLLGTRRGVGTLRDVRCARRVRAGRTRARLTPRTRRARRSLALCQVVALPRQDTCLIGRVLRLHGRYTRILVLLTGKSI